jgi:hypothetical protein
MNYGTLVMVDGSVPLPRNSASPPDLDAGRRRGLVRLGGALAPPMQEFVDPSKTTFVVELNYSERAFRLSERDGRFVPEISVEYSRQFKRLASGGNPLKDAKNFVAKFAGCNEAHKLRKRVIALSRMRNTISGETFRFPLRAADPVYLCVRNKITDVHTCIPENHFDKKREEIIGGPYKTPKECLANCLSEVTP